MNAITKYNVRRVELHISKGRFDTGSTLARKLRAEAKAGTAKYRPSRSPYDQKVYATIDANSPILEDLLKISEVAILRGFDTEAFTLGNIVPAWSHVFNAKEPGKRTARVFESLAQLDDMIEKAVEQVSDRNKHVRVS
jgi:hypothetical protein